MNTFTAQDMEDYGRYVANLDSAMLSPNFEKWCKERFEPAKKVIDLSVLIESGIDVESPALWGDAEVWSPIGRLFYIRDENYYTSCGPVLELRPRMNHIHAWQGNECPIEGFVVRAWLDKEDFVTIHTSDNFINWNDFVYIEFLEVEHGYVMPWGVSDD